MIGNLWFDYIYIATAEEAIFRMIPLELLATKYPLKAFLLAILPYALLHFIKFDVIVVILCAVLATVNSLIYYNMKRPFGYIVCVILHYIGGIILYLTYLKGAL